jgi:hypothetical protein
MLRQGPAFEPEERDGFVARAVDLFLNGVRKRA